jgi:hypothetical protein
MNMFTVFLSFDINFVMPAEIDCCSMLLRILFYNHLFMHIANENMLFTVFLNAYIERRNGIEYAQNWKLD